MIESGGLHVAQPIFCLSLVLLPLLLAKRNESGVVTDNNRAVQRIIGSTTKIGKAGMFYRSVKTVSRITRM